MLHPAHRRAVGTASASLEGVLPTAAPIAAFRVRVIDRVPRTEAAATARAAFHRVTGPVLPMAEAVVTPEAEQCRAIDRVPSPVVVAMPTGRVLRIAAGLPTLVAAAPLTAVAAASMVEAEDPMVEAEDAANS
jgi:hypothetical protein